MFSFWGDQNAKLKPCDLAACEALCCSNGIFLLKAEAAMIRKLVAEYPEHFPALPEHFIVKGGWEGYAGRKTAVRAYEYRNKPEHFHNTRCVFAESDGKCSFQTLAIAQGKHKWSYKPLGCWLFPLLLSPDRKLSGPPRYHKDDIDAIGEDYPGFTTYTPCGTHRRDGKVWWIALKEEIDYFNEKYGEPET